MDVRTIAVIGAGTMGSGIAQTAAQSGFNVVLEDVDERFVAAAFSRIRDRLEKRVSERKLRGDAMQGTLSRLRTGVGLRECRDADLVIEAVTEKEGLKKEIFRELDALCPPETILATNTSAIPVTNLAQATGRAEGFAGMHFMNPAYIMRLVEIIRSDRTSETTIAALVAVAERMGKTSVVVNDSPGFVISRVLMTMINDAVYCLREGVALREDIDTIMKLGAHHPMGPLELADLMGLDICLEILEVLHAGLGEKYRPCPLLKTMVAAGKLGRKSGEGFYEYK